MCGSNSSNSCIKDSFHGANAATAVHQESMKVDHRFVIFALRVLRADCIVASCFEDSYDVGNSGAIRDQIGGWCLELNITYVGK